MNGKAKARFYGLTSIVCTAWVIQTIVQAVKAGTLWTWLNLIFYISMLLVIIYTGLSAYQMWKADKAAKNSNKVNQERPERLKVE